MSHRRSIAIFVVITCSAAVVVASLLVGYAQRSDHRQAERAASLARALPVLKVAIQAALDRNAGSSAEAQAQRLEQGGPGAYFQFITVVTVREPNARLTSQWGHDFTWRGNRYHWPTNPYSGRPMRQGTGPGDFSVRFIWYGYVSGNPEAIELTIHGSHGQPSLTVTASSPTMPIETSAGQSR